MGGGSRYEYPRYVWAPTGGWWASNKNWKRNTAVIGLAVALSCIPVYNFSVRREERPLKPISVPAHLQPPPNAADGSHH